MVDMETFSCEMASRKYFTSAVSEEKSSVMMILISFMLKLGFCSSDRYLINVDLLLSFTSEGGVPQQQHHRVDVVSHPRSLDLEVPLEQEF